MDAVMTLLVGCLYTAGFYLLLRRTLAQLVLGLAILTNATNMLIFTSARVTREGAPLIPEGESAPVGMVADPVPQALILTAIVIGFGVLAFFIALAYRTFRTVGTDDLDSLTSTDQLSYGEQKVPYDEHIEAPESAEAPVRGGSD
jgi:multicomponent Na+:H+ antiporter subunit C